MPNAPRCGHPAHRSLDAALAFAILASLGQQRRSIGTSNPSKPMDFPDGHLEKIKVHPRQPTGEFATVGCLHRNPLRTGRAAGAGSLTAIDEDVDLPGFDAVEPAMDPRE
jgi:hypothetical protein